MKVEKANTVFQHKITGGDEYQWHCWPDARFLDYECEWAHACIVYSTVTQEIYEANIVQTAGDLAYRWINPTWLQAMKDEANERGVDNKKAWDNVEWIDLEMWSDFDEKSTALWRGEIPDSRVVMQIDISDEDFMHIAKLAHERDITINKMIEAMLLEVIETEGEKA